MRQGELILDRGLVDKTALIQAIEEVSGVPYLDCSTVQCEASALQAVSAAVARRLAVLPIHTRKFDAPLWRWRSPKSLIVIDELRFVSGKKISPRLSFRSEILAAILRNYELTGLEPSSKIDTPSSPEIISEPSQEIEFISTSGRQANREAILEVQAEINQKKTPAVRLVSEIIRTALSKRASDIHIEPQANATTVPHSRGWSAARTRVHPPLHSERGSHLTDKNPL